MNKVADTVLRQLIATGCARLPWKKVRSAVRETALVIAYEQGRKIGRREGADRGFDAAERRIAFRIEAQRGIDEVEVASQVSRRVCLEHGRPSQPQQ